MMDSKFSQLWKSVGELNWFGYLILLLILVGVGVYFELYVAVLGYFALSLILYISAIQRVWSEESSVLGEYFPLINGALSATALWILTYAIFDVATGSIMYKITGGVIAITTLFLGVFLPTATEEFGDDLVFVGPNTLTRSSTLLEDPVMSIISSVNKQTSETIEHYNDETICLIPHKRYESEFLLWNAMNRDTLMDSIKDEETEDWDRVFDMAPKCEFCNSTIHPNDGDISNWYKFEVVSHKLGIVRMKRSQNLCLNCRKSVVLEIAEDPAEPISTEEVFVHTV